VLLQKSAEITYFGIRRRCTYEVVEDLVADNARHFEALLAGDRVDNHVAMDADEVFRVEDAILILCIVMSEHDFLQLAATGTCGSTCNWCGYRIRSLEWGWRSRRDAGRRKACKYLASCVDDLGRKFLVLVADEFAERVLYGRVIAVHKVAVDKLHRQTRLSCALH